MTEQYRLWKGLRVRLVEPDVILTSMPPRQTIEIPSARGGIYRRSAFVHDLAPDPTPPIVYAMRFEKGDHAIFNFREVEITHRSISRGLYKVSWSGEGYTTIEGITDDLLSPMPELE